MKKGRLLGAGATAEVFEWGQDKVLKLYFDKYSNSDWVNNEAKIGQIISESGINSPAVYGEVEVEGRRGIIYQRIFGKTILEHVATQPWKLYYYIQQTAVLQYNIHKCTAEGLRTQKEKFEYAIRMSSYILHDKTKKILDYVDTLPDSGSICHGDLYCNNVIVSGKKLIPIDWNGAYKGNPLGDVARTFMIICSPAVPKGIPDAAAMLSYYPKKLAYEVYLSEYIKQSGARFEDIDAWILPVAAAKLKDKIPGERKWLMNIVDKRLEKLK